VIELLDQDKVFIKELLIADHLLSTAVPHIARLLPSDEYILRTPPFLGRELSSSIRPFGMFRLNQGFQPEIIPEGSGYLGLAFD
jgi:hypothetical protein